MKRYRSCRMTLSKQEKRMGNKRIRCGKMFRRVLECGEQREGKIQFSRPWH